MFRFSRALLTFFTFVLISLPGHAQFSDTYNFIKELKDGNFDAAREQFTLDVSPNARDGDGVPVLVIAVEQRSLEMTRFLLDQGANVNGATRDRGESALMRATAQGFEPAMTLLLERGADIDLQDKAGETAVIKAVLSRQRRAAELLVEAGANPNIADFKGRSAYDYAQESRSRAFRRMFE